MKGNVVMETIDRELAGKIVPQRTKDNFLGLGEILGIVNMDRISIGKQPVQFSHFLNSENTAEFVKELEKQTNAPVYYKATKSSRGWVHPFLALKFLTHYNPKFEICVYRWLFDHLIQNRISSADSFNKMSGIIYKYAPNKAKFPQMIQWTAKKIKEVIGADDWNKATIEQLRRRDELQNLISDLISSVGDCRLGFKIALKADSQKYGGAYADIELEIMGKN